VAAGVEFRDEQGLLLLPDRALLPRPDTFVESLSPVYLRIPLPMMCIGPLAEGDFA
jgi:hypothetical protein